MMFKNAMESLVPKVSHRIYKMISPEGYYYVGLTKLAKDDCLMNHHKCSVTHPHFKIYDHLKGPLDDGTMKFEILEEIISRIGGQSLTRYELNFKLNEHVKLHLGKEMCVNQKFAIGLNDDSLVVCECGGIYPRSKHENHKRTIKHNSFYEKDSSSD